MCIVHPILSLFNKKLRTNKFSFSISLLGEVRFLVRKEFVGHAIFEGFITKVLTLRSNKKIYRIKYENDDKEDITFQELKTLTTTKQKQDTS